MLVFSIGVATFSWQQRYGYLPTNPHVALRFLAETGSYFIGSMPFAIIPRYAGLVFGLSVLLIRAFVA